MQNFRITPTVKLHQTIHDESGSAADAINYYMREFFVTAETIQEACDLVREKVTDGTIKEFRGGPTKELPENYDFSQADASQKGIKFQSGRYLISDSARNEASS